MRFVSGLAISALMTLPALACNDQFFTLEDWSATATEDGRNLRTVMTVDLNYKGERSYRMIHGAALFSDVLGNALVTVPFERDAQVEPGQTVEAKGAFIGKDSRITTINRDDVLTRTCVWSIVYDDGTVEEF